MPADPPQLTPVSPTPTLESQRSAAISDGPAAAARPSLLSVLRSIAATSVPGLSSEIGRLKEESGVRGRLSPVAAARVLPRAFARSVSTAMAPRWLTMAATVRKMKRRRGWSSHLPLAAAPLILLHASARALWSTALETAMAIAATLRRLPPFQRLVAARERARIAASGLFDETYYAARYADVRLSSLTALEHYVLRGAREARQPHPLFDGELYRRRHLAVRRFKVNPLLHYLRVGASKELDPGPLFSASFYLDGSPDAAASGLTPLQHYLTRGWRDLRSPHPLFDPEYFRRRYPFVERHKLDPLCHFVVRGASEFLDPNVHFDSRYYLEMNPEVRREGINPLLHFLQRGAAQGCDPGPTFDTQAYLRQYPDVALHGINPLVHFVLRGQAEGRKPYITSPASWEQTTAQPYTLRLHPGRPKALFVLPDGTDTALTRLMLALVAHFDRERSMDCVVVFADEGPLHTAFEVHGVVLVERYFGTEVPDRGGALDSLDLTDVRLALVASARAAEFLRPLARLRIPSVCLIDEYLDEAPRRSAEIATRYAGRLVFPTRAVLEAAQAASPLADDQGRVIAAGGIRPRVRGVDRAGLRRDLFGPEAARDELVIVLGCAPAGSAGGAADFRAIAEVAGRHASGRAPRLLFAWVRRGADASSDPSPSVAGQMSDGAPDIRDLGQRADLSDLLLCADVMLWTGARDSFPSTVLEALAAGLPVIAWRERGGTSQALEGSAGRALEAGDVEGAAAALLELAADPATREAMGRTGQKLVRERHGKDRFAEELCDVLARDLGVDLPAVRSAGLAAASTFGPKVVFTTPEWNISGVNTFTETLMKGLARRGFEVELLVTGKDLHPDFLPEVPYRFLDQVIPGTGGRWSSERWSRVLQYLVREAPCIFVPGYDYFASAVSAALPHDVGILGIVHSDDVEHYEHAARLGRYWNGLVGVSRRCYERMLDLDPGLKPVAHTIPYGIELPAPSERARRDPAAALRIVWTGRVEQVQKNVLAIPGVVRELDAAGVHYVLTLIGDGSQKQALSASLAQHLADGRVRMPGRLSVAAVREELRASDVFLLVSFFEGLPVSMLEAMAYGCVPVSADIDSGVPELIEQGVTGYRVPVHDSAAFAASLRRLAQDPDRLQSMSRAASALIYARYGADRMVSDYADVLTDIWREVTRDIYRRPSTPTPPSGIGPVLLPAWMQRDPATFP